MSRSPLFFFLTSVVVFQNLPADGARILLIADSMSSHVILFSRLGIDLARLGHDVTLLVPSNARVPELVLQHQKRIDSTSQLAQSSSTAEGTFSFSTYAVDDIQTWTTLTEYNNKIIQSALTDSLVQRLRILRQIGNYAYEQLEKDNRQLVENREVFEAVKRRGYHFVILEPGTMAYTIPLALGIPYACLSVGISLIDAFRVPRLPSFCPSFSKPYGDRMTLMQRMVNFVTEMSLMFMVRQASARKIPLGIYGSNDSPLANSSLTVMEAVRRSSLWFLVEDSVVGYAVPHMPNTVSVGDIMAGRAGLPLPTELENFVGSSGDGVIVVSFGSYLENIPEYINAKFCDAFKRLPPGIVVIWKSKNADRCSDSARVKVLSWIPQNDLLADYRTRVFISHGGLNGLMESVYHAKPVIVFPMYGDQQTNAVAAVHKGYAISMNIGRFTSDELLANINTILSDGKYESNVRLASSILRDRRDTAAERISEMVNHVIAYGAEHLRSGAFELNVFEYLMLDVFSVLYVSALLIVVTVIAGMRFVWLKFVNRVRLINSFKKK